MLPNAALYQTEPRLDYRFFSPRIWCKWSSMWSKRFLTEILSYRKHRDSVVSKAMCHKRLCNALQRFYAPERSALPNWATSRLFNFSPQIWCKWSNMWSKRFLTKISARQNCHNGVVSKEMCNKRLCNALQRFYAPEESWKRPFRHKWLFIAVSAPRYILFGGLVSVVSVCSGDVYGQVCGHFSAATKKNF